MYSISPATFFLASTRVFLRRVVTFVARLSKSAIRRCSFLTSSLMNPLCCCSDGSVRVIQLILSSVEVISSFAGLRASSTWLVYPITPCALASAPTSGRDFASSSAFFSASSESVIIPAISLTFSSSSAFLFAKSVSFLTRSACLAMSRSFSRDIPTITLSRWTSLPLTPLAPPFTKTSKIKSTASEGKAKPNSPSAYCKTSRLLSTPSRSLSCFLNEVWAWSMSFWQSIFFSLFCFSVIEADNTSCDWLLHETILCWSVVRLGFPSLGPSIG
mmetsp:Transcript_14512/g.41566  ORF Transcript_14512/g.41566 Transcript_14512/m.41566 type:complete len:273 (-) Transcript_14512:1321-2139(-)